MLKVFKNEKTAKSAVKHQGLHLMQYEIKNHCSAAGTGVIVNFFVEDSDDLHEIQSRGFAAEIAR